MRALLMRLTLLTSLLLVATACNKTLATRPPLPGRLYYPTGLAFVPPATDGGVGRIYVASANFDRRFENGWVTSIDLSLVLSQDGRSLPPPGVSIAPPPDVKPSVKPAMRSSEVRTPSCAATMTALR